MHPGDKLRNVRFYQPLIDADQMAIVIPHTRGRMIQATGPNLGDMPVDVITVWRCLASMNDELNFAEVRAGLRLGRGTGRGRVPELKTLNQVHHKEWHFRKSWLWSVNRGSL